MSNWVLDKKNNFAAKLYSDSAESSVTDQGVTSHKAKKGSLEVDDFSGASLSNTHVNEDGSIALSLPDKDITFVFDNSGSLAWNDKNGLRYDMAERLVRKISATYPGNVRYNVFSSSGSKVKVNLGATTISDSPFDPNNLTDSNNTNPFIDIENNFGGVRVVKKKGSYPTTPLDGEKVFEGAATRVVDTGFVEGEQSFYKIFTYDAGLTRFSKGIPFTVKASSRNLPTGLKNFSGRVLRGSGIQVDDSVLGVWHFNEINDIRLYDFSSKSHLSLSGDYRWLSRNEVPVGNGGLRFNSGVYAKATDAFSLLASRPQMTFLGYVYPFDFTADRTILARDNASQVDYRIYLQSGTGKLVYEDSSGVYVSNFVFPANKWSHFGVKKDEILHKIYFYFNGIITETLDYVSVETPNALFDFTLGNSSKYPDGFFGYLTEVSLHSDARDDSYIARSSLGRTLSVEDNGDRLVLLTYSVPHNADSLGGNAVLVAKPYELPSWEGDGEIVSSLSITEGDHFSTFRTDLVFLRDYGFGLFTTNSQGNFSNISDTERFMLTIPQVSEEVFESLNQVSLPPPSSVNVIPGYKKIFISWDSVNVPPDAMGVKVYCSNKGFPVSQPDGLSTGKLVFDGLVSEGGFVHRNLNHGTVYNYSVAFIDKYNRFSSAVNVTSRPVEDDVPVIPLEEVKDISYEISAKGLEIYWKDPFTKKKLEVGFNDQVLFFARITDDFGKSFSSDLLKADTSASVKVNYFDGAAEDVFGSKAFDPSPSTNLYDIVTSNENGLIKTFLTLKENKYLPNVESVDVTLTLKLSLRDSNNSIVFDYRSLPVVVRFVNPFNMRVTNKNNYKVKIDSKKTVSVLGKQSLPTSNEYDGLYINSPNTFTARVFFSFDGSPIDSSMSLSTEVYTAAKDLKDSSDVPSKLFISRNVSVFNNPSIITSDIDVLDQFGNPTGRTKKATYVDVELNTPSHPENVLLYIKAEKDGLSIVKSIFVVYKNTLQIDLVAKAPVADGIDVAKQFAYVYVVDPAHPDDITKRKFVTDNTLVKWEITKGNNIDRPFYSTDSVSIPNSVVSLTKKGVATNVFFGPVFDVNFQGFGVLGEPEFENYDISATVIYKGLSITESETVQLVPIIELKKQRVGSYLLAELEDVKTKIYADGKSFAKMRITHDPSTSTTKFSDCFRECLLRQDKELFKLNPGTLVKVEASSTQVEILWGDVFEHTDPYTGEVTLNTTLAKTSMGSAFIPLAEADHTNVYFRIDTQVDQRPIAIQKRLDGCDCIFGNEIVEYSNEIRIVTFVTTIFDQRVVNLVGGGDVVHGIPPTILVPEEPLAIRLVGKKSDGKIVEGLVIDGVSRNKLIFDVSYAGQPLTENAYVTFDVINSSESAIELENSTEVPLLTIDDTVDSFEIRSYVSTFIKPILPNKGFKSFLVLTLNYSKEGVSSRFRSYCLSISYEPDMSSGKVSSTTGTVTNIFNDRLQRYDINNNLWSDKARINYPRALMSLCAYSGNLFAVGGVDSDSISSVLEKYSIEDDKWNVLTPMPAGKISPVSMVVGDNLYVFGGIAYDKLSNSLKISNSAFRYAINEDVWYPLASFPVIDNQNYGLAFSAPVLSSDGNTIVFLSGIKSLSELGTVPIMNDRVFSYNIVSGNWTYTDAISEDELPQYSRISPVTFIKNNTAYVFGGVYQNLNGTIGYLADSYSYSLNTGEMKSADPEFGNIIGPRYKACYATSGSKVFSLGGSTANSEYSYDFEAIDFSTSLFSYSKLDNFDRGLTSASMVATELSGSPQLFVVGGMQSGKSPGFAKIESKLIGDNLQLDGIKKSGFSLSIKDEAENFISKDLKVKLRGFVQFATEEGVRESIINDKLVKYPVGIVGGNELTAKDGRLEVLLEPRTDDPINFLKNKYVKLPDGTVVKYKIVLQAIIIDDEYFGQTLVTTANNPNFDETQINEMDCVSIFTNTLVESLSLGVDGKRYFRILPTPVAQPKAPAINVVAKDIYLPSVQMITDGPSNARDAITAIQYLSSKQASGPSPTFDAINSAARFLSSQVAGRKRKNVYVFTDDEENSSKINRENLLVNLQNIDSTKDVPFVGINMKVNDPVTFHNFEDLSGVSYLDTISQATHGQSITVNSPPLVDDYCKALTGDLVGTLGYGSSEYVCDLGQECLLQSVAAFFRLYENTVGTWSIALSSDGHYYTPYSIRFRPNYEASFDNEKVRYIKFKFTLSSGLSESNNSAYDDIPLPDVPSVNSIVIKFKKKSVDFIYFTPKALGDKAEFDGSPKEISIATSSNVAKVNAKLYCSYSNTQVAHWRYFSNDIKPAVEFSGKIISPNRGKSSSQGGVEPLNRVDGYLFKTFYGPWEPDAKVEIFDEIGSLISSDRYKLYPKSGMVVFAEKVDNQLTIAVQKKNSIRLGFRIDNYDHEKRVKLFGFSYIYR